MSRSQWGLFVFWKPCSVVYIHYDDSIMYTMITMIIMNRTVFVDSQREKLRERVNEGVENHQKTRDPVSPDHSYKPSI
jgi:hypothetical protein